MIDLGFSKLVIIGVVALVVVGPEKLPRVARTAGTLLGRAQRYVNDLKKEVSQQMNVSEINEMRKTVEEAARNAQASLKKTETSIAKSLHDTNKELEDVWKEADQKKPFTPNVPSTGKLENMTPAPDATSLSPPSSESIQARLQALRSPDVKEVQATTVLTSSKVKENNTIEASEIRSHRGQAQWRAQRMATPLWYKRRQRSKSTLRSDAAKCAQKNHS